MSKSKVPNKILIILFRDEGRSRIQTDIDVKDRIRFFSKSKIEGYQAAKLEPWQRKGGIGPDGQEYVEEHEHEHEEE